MIGNTLRREKVEISLLNSFSRKCIILEKERVSDGEGGYITTWKDGAEFENYMAIDTSMEARIAEKQGVTSVYSALVGISVPINYGDYFRDVEYNTVYRVTSNPNEKQAPKSSSFNLKYFTAERTELPK